MFSNISNKIKTLAKVVCGIGIGVSVVVGLVLISEDEDTVFAGILVLLLGSILSWVGSFITYGFGEIIERLVNIDEKMSSTDGLSYAAISKIETLKKWKEQGLITDTEYAEKMAQIQGGHLQ